MSIMFRCNKCGKSFKVSDDKAGNRVKCNQCSAVIQVPALKSGLKKKVGNEADPINPKILAAVGAGVVVLICLILGIFVFSGSGDLVADSMSRVNDVKNAMSAEQLEMGDPEVNTIGMIMVPIRLGKFKTGKHVIIISKPYYMSSTEVTQGQWNAIMETKPWNFVKQPLKKNGKNYPATCINWQDAVEFCDRLSELEGHTYRLPTEAEWEYACRAGSRTSFSCGDHEIKKYGWTNDAGIDTHQPKLNQRIARNAFPHEVATKLPNPWGLYDMHGNVSEWCSDWIDYYPNNYLLDPTGPPKGKLKVVRGGNAQIPSTYSASGYRGKGVAPDSGQDFKFLGFRVVREYALPSGKNEADKKATPKSQMP